jgi:pilus assembly protein CpaB
MATKKTKSGIRLLLVLLLAVGAGLLNYSWLTSRQTNEAEVVVKEPETVHVLVAAANLPRGTVLTADQLRIAPYLKDACPLNAFSSPQEVEGRTLMTALEVNEPILPSRLNPIDTGTGGVPAMLSAGKRAMAVAGNKVIGLAGLVRPGDKVDVLVTLDDVHGKPVTKTVLMKLPVLAVGTMLDHTQGEDGKPLPVDIYTLEVTPEEGETLALAATQGTLNFALRGGVDDEDVLTHGADIDRTLAAYRPAPPPVKVKTRMVRRLQPTRTEVQVIRGESVSTVSF